MDAAMLEEAPTYSIQDSVIDEMEHSYMVLAVDDVDDKAGIARVHEARMEVRAARLAVEKRRKELKADALAYGQKVDAEARRIKTRLEPIEAHLQHQEDIVKREKERIAREAEEKRQAKLRGRLQQLADCGCQLLAEEAESLSDEEFATLIEDAKKAKAEAEAQAAAAAEARRLEDERLKAEREELERVRREQAEAQAKIDAEKAAVEAEAARIRREEELAKAREEAAEKAAAEERARIEREAAERAAEAERVAKEDARREAQRPDASKLIRFAETLRNLEVPQLSDHAAKERAEVIDAMNALQVVVCRAAKRLAGE